tara:strand:- start:55 stop:888 length:834 start_codon:yes stop_codon:yes gene_type:complete
MTLRLNGSSSGFTEVKAPAAAGSNTITLPTSNGSAEQFLKNSGTAGELEYSSMVETSTGVGIGTTSPAAKLQVNDGYLKVSTNSTFSANGTNNFYQSSTSDFGLLVGGYGAYASTVLVLEGTNATGASFNLLQGYRAGNATTGAGGTLSINIAGSGNVTNSFNSYGAISDIKLKENIVDASSQWDDIKAFQIRNYNFKEETGQETQTQIGVIAQEIETVSPGLVYETADRDREGNDLGTVTKNVNYSVLYMKAVKALQEAQTRIETLETKVAALEAA